MKNKKSLIVGGIIFVALAFIITTSVQSKSLVLSREAYQLISLIFGLSALVFIAIGIRKVIHSPSEPTEKVVQIENIKKDYWEKSYQIFMLITCLDLLGLFFLLVAGGTILSKFPEFNISVTRSYLILAVTFVLFGLCTYLFKKRSSLAIPVGYIVAISGLLIQTYLTVTNFKINISVILTYVIYYQLLKSIRGAQTQKGVTSTGSISTPEKTGSNIVN
ncbi:MAG: hypothetical protein WCG97_00725 [bacterium]